MKIVYQITLYHKLDQFKWLLAALYNTDDYFIIHVDEHSPDAYRNDIVAICGNLPNVHLQRSISVYWGGWSIVETQLQGISKAIKLWPNWDYFLNLSGQDYPLQKRDGISKYLAKLEGSSAVACNFMPDLAINIRWRTWLQCVEFGNRVHRLPIPRSDILFRKINWKGSGWHILSREFCEWLQSSPITDKWRLRCRRVMLPDEFYFQNLIMDSPFRVSRRNDNGRFVLWEKNAARPRVLCRNDIERILKSGKIFARKFDNEVDADILTLLAKAIGHATPD
jgi:hypothetical protein